MAQAGKQRGLMGALGSLGGAAIGKWCWVAREVYGATIRRGLTSANGCSCEHQVGSAPCISDTANASQNSSATNLD